MKLKGKQLLAYTAGLIDGEGSICLATGKRKDYKSGRIIYLKVSIVNTNEWLINWLKMQYGGYISSNDRSGKKWKTRWAWEIQHNHALRFLEMILPYLQIKRPQAELAIQFQRAKRRGGPPRTAETLALQQAQRILMQKMNKRGIEHESY